jgi:hypothetical protein
MNLKSILVFYARLMGVVLLVECVTCWGWSRWFWTPIQTHYMGAYISTSVSGILPVSALKIRWIWKTAPGGKHELAIEDDAVRIHSTEHDRTGMELSQSARDAGWTSLFEGGPEPIALGKLKPVLSDQVFEGQGVWIFVLTPGLIGFGTTILLLHGLIWLEGWLPELPWRRQRFPWDDQSPNILESCAVWVERIPSVIVPLRRLANQRTRMPPVVSTDATDTETSVRRASIAFPPFGANGGSISKVYRWSERDEID